MAGIIEVKDQGKLRIYDADNSNYIDIVVPSTVSSNRTITLPDASFTVPQADTDTVGLTGVSTGSGNVTITDGNLVLASGHGIDFAATGNVSGTSSELLDDYEEGTWTPGVNQGTINNISSSYIKVGNKVTVFSNIDTFSNRTSTETVEVSSLPFAIASATQGKAVGSVLIRYSDKLVSAAYSRSGSAIGFYASIASGYVPLKFNDLNNSSANMTFIATYTV